MAEGRQVGPALGADGPAPVGPVGEGQRPTGVIVQGRYDMICPPHTAYALHRAWPGSTLRMIQTAGHALSEPGISSELVGIMDTLRA